MKNALIGIVVTIACVLAVLQVSGCLGCGFGGFGGAATPTPTPELISVPATQTPIPSATQAVPTWEYSTANPVSVTATSTPAPVTVTPIAGRVDAAIEGYGTDKDTYNRGDTATCYVNIRNTGEATINRVDFRVDVYRSAFGMMIHAINNQTYTVDQQNIQPGETKRVEISVVIPAEYQGMSTAGNYRFDIAVIAGGKNIGGFSKDVKVV